MSLTLRSAPLLAIALGLLYATTISALIMVGKGNDPVADDHWPAGALEVANLKSRVGWYEGPPFGGGEHAFQYRGDAASFQQALDAFAKIRSPELQLVVHDGGPAESPFLKDDNDPKSDAHYDWSFTVWNPENWNHLYNTPTGYFSSQDPSGAFRSSVAPPRVDVYVGGDKRGIDFSKVKVPANIAVTDERADVAGFAGGSVVVCDVFDQTTSKPVAHAKVSLATQKAYQEWETKVEAETDTAGHLEMSKVVTGHFGVLVSCSGYGTRMIGYVELRGNTLKRFTTQLAPAAVIRGTVTDSANKAIAGATVRADSTIGPDGRGYIVPTRLETKTDPEGKFELTGLPRGHTQLFAHAPNFHMVDVLKLQTTPTDGMSIRLSSTGTVKVKVMTKSGAPATQGNISINPPGPLKIGSWGGSANTQPDGTYTFEEVPPGEYVITAMATNPGPPAPKGKDPNAKTVTVKPGEVMEVEVRGR